MSFRSRLASRLAAASAAAVTLALVLSACSGGKDAVVQGAGGQFRYIGTTPTGKTIPEGSRKAAGNVSGDLLGGGQFSLEGNAGKVTVLNFWASWCIPCLSESPQYDSLYRDLKSTGVEFVGLDVKETGQSQPLSFIKSNNITYPSVYDPDAKTALQLGKVPATTVGLPWTVVVDKHSKVAAVYVGVQQTADLKPVLQTLAVEK
jgi:thiol-disulfide isomerase/thioredoxin